ncbi:GNAT family N-acetyltransferase [Longispora albida]|uniref:GNAT family N-acetyltransferase n=1 Tax=Longispora albida TaxID=203523 RepID=UPI0003705F3A|nr:GNAT family N-acetyltransferase [Longispora albida]
MTDYVIRPAVLDDVEQWVTIRQAIQPYMCASVEAQKSWFVAASPKARTRRIVAVREDGRILGFATGGLNATVSEPVGELSLNVHPEFRGQGVGSALYAEIEEYVLSMAPLRMRGWSTDEPEALDWVRRRGYEPKSSDRWSRVDPRNLPPVPPAPEGVELIALRELGPEAAHAFDTAAFADEPGDVPYEGMPYEDFLARVWNSPDMQLDISLVAMAGGRAVAATFVEANLAAGKAMASGTATLPEYRGRGLSKYLKSVSLRKAAEAGVTAAYTGNDYTNAPMLAINDWLGYQVVATQWSCVKEL